MFPIWEKYDVAARGGVSMCVGDVYGMLQGLFEFVGFVFWQSKGGSRPSHFGVRDSSEASAPWVVGDVGLGAEGEVDWVAVDNSLDLEAFVQCVVYDFWDGPCAVEALLWLWLVVFVEFGFCNFVVCDVNDSVSVCEFS